MRHTLCISPCLQRQGYPAGYSPGPLATLCLAMSLLLTPHSKGQPQPARVSPGDPPGSSGKASAFIHTEAFPATRAHNPESCDSRTLKGTAPKVNTVPHARHFRETEHSTGDSTQRSEVTKRGGNPTKRGRVICTCVCTAETNTAL